jgi:subtilisin family serine protease
VRRLRLFAAIVASISLAIIQGVPASAAPGPRSDQWWFKGWAIQDGVWQRTKGAGVTVAVLDTGANVELRELRGAVSPGYEGGNKTRRGLVDTDKELGGHGTGVTALIAARGGGSGYMGVAPEAKILSFPDRDELVAEAKAIRHAVDRGARVINMSHTGFTDFDSTCPEVLQRAILYAVEHDVVLIAGAGNEGDLSNYPESPANCAGVVAVGAVDSSGKIWPKTQRQEYVTLAAPGWNTPVLLKDGRIASASGTSIATALMSGVVALMRSAHPDMKGREVVRRLIGTAQDVGPRGKDNRTGYGFVRIRQALTEDVAAKTPNPPYERLDQWVAKHGKEAPTPSNSVYTPSGARGSDSAPTLGELAVIGLAVLAIIAIPIALLALRFRRRPQPPASQPVASAGPPPGWGGHPPADQPTIRAPYGRNQKSGNDN